MNAVVRDARSERAELVLQKDPDAEVNRVETLGLRWAELDEEASLLEETKKTLLAQFTRDTQRGAGNGGGKPMAMNQAECLALADPRYAVHLEAMVKKRGLANRARVSYDCARVGLELWRSYIAAQREAMRFGGLRT